MSAVECVPGAEDTASFAAYHSWRTKQLGLSIPESELRQHFEANADGSVGKERIPPEVSKQISAAMDAGGRKYTDIRGSCNLLAIRSGSAPLCCEHIRSQSAKCARGPIEKRKLLYIYSE